MAGTYRHVCLDPEVQPRPLPSERVRAAAALPLGRAREDLNLRRRPNVRRR